MGEPPPDLSQGQAKLDLDQETYARIRASTEANIRLESFYVPCPPKELIMSVLTVMEQRFKAEEIAARLRSRLKDAEGPKG